nr:DNA polymerase [Saccharomycopsis crataegensis]
MDLSKEAINRLKEKLKSNFDILPLDVKDILISNEIKTINEEKEKASKISLERHIAGVKYRNSKIKKGREKVSKWSYDKIVKSTVSEINTTYNVDLKLNTFNLDLLKSYKEEYNNFIENLKNKRFYLDFRFCHLYYYIEKNGKIFASTRITRITPKSFEEDISRSFDKLQDLIDSLQEDIYGYQPILTEGQCNTLAIFKFHYVTVPRCIENWNLDQETIYFNFAKLFCANKSNKSCIEQCSNFLWNIDISDFNQFLEQERLVVFEPKSYIKNISDIKNFYDLQLCHFSKNTFKDNHHCVLYFKEHIGVLYDFNLSFINTSYSVTKFTPLTSAPYELNTVCFDIECYFDPNMDLSQVNIPYLCCYTYLGDENRKIYSSKGRDCVLEMLNSVSKQYPFETVELIAHNGGNYDFHYIISSIHDPSIIKNIMIRNNSFISFEFELDSTKFVVKDSYSFLLCSLANAAKAFNVDSAKTDFPHHLIKSSKDVNLELPKWDSIEEVLNVHYEKDRMFITSDNIIHYSKDKTSKKLIDWAKEYCMNDVLVLADVWIKFKQAVFDIFESDVVNKSHTLAGMSFNLFKAFLSPDVFLIHPRKEDYLNIRKSLIGGRCISTNGMHEDVLCLDVKSLYPAAMAYYDQPYGMMKKVKTIDNNKLGVYYVKVFPNKNSTSNFFPLRKEDNSVYYFNNSEKEYTAWYTIVDINIGLQEGHKIEYTAFDETGYIGYEWESKGKIFKDYIENVLYKYKLKFEKENNKVKRQVIKIIMNSLWGKFAQKWIDTSYSFKLGWEIDIEDDAYMVWDTEYVLVKGKEDKESGNKPIQNGVFTLSYARLHMKKLWDAAVKNNTTCLYSDTDSIFVKKSDFDLNAKIGDIPVIGSDMGQLELEATLDSLICAGKKQYIGFKKIIDDESEKVVEKSRFKGIPSKYVTPDMFSFLLKSKDNKAVVKFLKFRREWGSVRGYIESKEVKAT